MATKHRPRNGTESENGRMFKRHAWNWERPLPGILLATLSTAGTVLARWLLDPVLGGVGQYTLSYVAVALASIVAGRTSGIVATLLAGGAGFGLFVVIPGRFENHGSQYIAQLSLYLLTALLLVAVAEWGRKKNAQALQELRGRQEAENDRRNAEVQSERRYRRIIDVAAEGIWQIDHEFRTVEVNERMAQILGCPRAELIGQPIWPYMAPGEEADVEQRFLNRASGVTECYERRLLRKDGTTVWVSVSAAPLHDDSGRQTGSFGMFTDISERKETEERLRRSHDTFRSLVENNPFGILVVNSEFRLLHVSVGAQKIFRNVRPLAGRNLEEVLRAVWDEPFATEAVAHFQHTLDSGESYAAPQTAEFKKNGGELETYDWRIERVTLPDGRFGLVCHFYDLTERRLWERELEDSRELLGTIVRHMPAAVCLIRGSDLRLQMVNAAYQSIAPNIPMIGKTLDELWPDTRKNLSTLCRRVLASGEAIHVEDDSVPIRRNEDGPLVDAYFSWSLHRVRLPGSEGWGILNTAWETTESKKAAEALKTAREQADMANQAKSLFLANMSHEIRTPLNAIIGFSELLIRCASSQQEREEFASRIQRNGELLVRLIDDILDLTKIEAGKLLTETVKLNFQELLNDVFTVMENRAREKGIAFTVESVSPLPATIHSDPIRFKQILSNVIGNAIKFTSQGEVKVTIGCDPSARTMRFLCRDTGIGLSQKQFDRLFQPFSQADDSMTRRFGGTGLGLILSRRLATALGGDVRLLESQPERGSTFEITLALEEPTFGDEPSAQEHVESPPSLAGIRILLAEDTPDSRLLVEKILTTAGAHVEGAADGEEAVAKGLSGVFEVILMDMRMPRMSGFEATAVLRRRGFAGPIVALTAHAMPEEISQCLAAGCTHHLAKPVHHTNLIRTIFRAVCASQGLR